MCVGKLTRESDTATKSSRFAKLTSYFFDFERKNEEWRVREREMTRVLSHFQVPRGMFSLY